MTQRLERKLEAWEGFRRALSGKEQEAYQELVAAVRNRRTALDALEEPDLSVALLLAMAVFLQGELRVREHDARQQRLGDGP